MFYLPKNLEHDHSLARSGISDDLHVLGLRPLRDADHCLYFVRLDAYAIPSTLSLNSLGVIISGPFSRLPYLSVLRRRMSLAMENGSWMTSDSRPKSSGACRDRKGHRYRKPHS